MYKGRASGHYDDRLRVVGDHERVTALVESPAESLVGQEAVGHAGAACGVVECKPINTRRGAQETFEIGSSHSLRIGSEATAPRHGHDQPQGNQDRLSPTGQPPRRVPAGHPGAAPTPNTRWGNKVEMTTTTESEVTEGEPAETARPRRPPFIAAALALLLFAGAAGFALGSRPSAPGPGSADVGFLYDMIAHHEQALTLANAELVAGSNNQAKAFAREILLFQSYEIGLMERQLAIWGYDRLEPPEKAMAWMGHPVEADAMPGMASPAELAALSDATGAQIDALFIALMQDHHRGGVHMAEAAAAEADSPFVENLAKRMARNQQLEIREMEIAREQAGLPADPPGYDRDPPSAFRRDGPRH